MLETPPNAHALAKRERREREKKRKIKYMNIIATTRYWYYSRAFDSRTSVKAVSPLGDYMQVVTCLLVTRNDARVKVGGAITLKTKLRSVIKLTRCYHRRESNG